MIRNRLGRTKRATFGVLVPHPKFEGVAIPNGTGFFISRDGYFLTAHHVVMGGDPSEFSVQQPRTTMVGPAIIVQFLEKVKEWPEFDIVLLRADFEKNRTKDWLKEKDGFPFLEMELQEQEEGTPVYSYAFPLPAEFILGKDYFVGTVTWRPRVTSAIISSTSEEIGPVVTGKEPKFYVLDKALNYGNGGSPIVLQETGRVIGLCLKFQPVVIPQPEGQQIMIPSLYGVATSLANIKSDLEKIDP